MIIHYSICPIYTNKSDISYNEWYTISDLIQNWEIDELKAIFNMYTVDGSNKKKQELNKKRVKLTLNTVYSIGIFAFKFFSSYIVC